MKSKKFKRVVTVIVLFVIAILIFYGAKENNVKILSDSIVIEGMYGKEISKEDIISVKLLDRFPKISLRKNGMSIFSLHKGVYKIEGFDTINLYLHGGDKYLLIDSKDRPVMISYKNSEKTTQLYNRIVDFLGNS